MRVYFIFERMVEQYSSCRLKAGWASRAASILADCSFCKVEDACRIFSDAISLRSSFSFHLYCLSSLPLLSRRVLLGKLLLFEQFYTLLNCSIRFIEVFQISFQSQHIIDNVAVYIRFQSFIRFLDQNIPSLYTFRVGKADELLYQTLVTKIIQQVFFRFILAQLLPIIVRVLESKLKS